jgi:hypothetical protein
MQTLEKLIFGVTLISFMLPLALNLDSGYRIYSFELPLAALVFLWLSRLVFSRERLRFEKFDLYFLLFSLWIALSLSFNDTWNTGGNLLLFWIKAYLIGFYVRYNLNRIISVHALITGLTIMLLLESLLGLFQGVNQSSFGVAQQYFGLETAHTTVFDSELTRLVRVQGTFKHCNILGNWIVMLLPFALVRAVTMKTNARRFYWLAAAIGLVVLILTLSRANWGALFFGLTVMAWRTNIIDFKKVNWPRMTLLACVASIYVISLAVTYSSELKLAFEVLYKRVEVLPDSRSSGLRLNAILAAATIVDENPLWGVGLGQSNEYLHYTEYEIRDSFRATVHNIFMIIASEGGIPACMIFVLMMWQVFRRTLQIVKRKSADRRRESYLNAAALLGGLSGLCFAMLWYTGMVDQSELPLIFVLANLGLGMARLDATEAKKNRNDGRGFSHTAPSYSWAGVRP